MDTDWHLRKKFIVFISTLTGEQLTSAFIRASSVLTDMPSQPVILSFAPSELWENRDKSRKENPVEFINRIYETVLDGYFTLVNLKAHDPKLYRALYNWTRENNDNKRPSLEILNLPTKPELNDRLLAEYGDHLTQTSKQLSPKYKAITSIRKIAADREYIKTRRKKLPSTIKNQK